MVPLKDPETTSTDPFSWSESARDEPVPEDPPTDPADPWPFVDFWPAVSTTDHTVVMFGKIDPETGQLEDIFIFTNRTATQGNVKGPSSELLGIADYDGRYTIVEHDDKGTLVMDVHCGEKPKMTSAFDIRITIMPITKIIYVNYAPVPISWSVVHIGGTRPVTDDPETTGASQYAEEYNEAQGVNLRTGTMLTGQSTYTHSPEGVQSVDFIGTLGRTVGVDGVVKYGIEWKVEEEITTGTWPRRKKKKVMVPYALTWTPIVTEEGK